MQIDRADIQRILIVKPSSLGDIIHALPVLAELRRAFPHARISWLVAGPFVDLIKGHPQVDDIIPFDRKTFGRFGRSWSASTGFVRFLREMRSHRFDLVIDLQGLFRSGLITGATGAKYRVGFRNAREAAWVFYNCPVQIDREDIHAVDRNLALLAAVGIVPGPAEFDLALSDPDSADAETLLKKCGIGPNDPYFVFAPGARWETKLWPVERFAGTADRLNREWTIPVVVVGAPSEKERCDNVVQSAESEIINLTGQTTLRQLSALIHRSRLLLCHDSAPMHLADAVRTPLVSITGPTNPIRTGPYRQRDGVIQLSLDCAPCYLRKLSDCRHQHRCMADLSVEMVVQKVRQVLEAHEKGTQSACLDRQQLND